MVERRLTSSRRAREEEFDDLVRRSGDRLLRTAYLLTGSWPTAQDLVQTALVQTWTHWSAIREPGAAEAYVRTCMVRTSASWWRRRWTGEVPTEVLPDRALGDQATEDVATSQVVLAALGTLDARHRAVLVLRFFADLSEADTAAALGVSVGTVKSRTSRALARLRGLDGAWAGPRRSSVSPSGCPSGWSRQPPAGPSG